MAVEIVYETHSISTDNESGHATGWLDGELSERGRALAVELGDRRRDDGIETIFSSDLGRAVETVRIAFQGCPIPVRLDARLRECNYGDWNGMPLSRFGPAERVRRIAEPYPGGESYRQAVDRMASFLTELARDPAGRRVLIVGHAATRWSLQHLLDGTPLEQLLTEPFEWREGWSYLLPDGWGRD
jgi:broad specificity phosphatase PhoE